MAEQEDALVALDDDAADLFALISKVVTEQQKQEIQVFQERFTTSRNRVNELVEEMSTIKKICFDDISDMNKQTSRQNIGIKMQQIENYTKLSGTILDAETKLFTMAERELKTMMEVLSKVKEMTEESGAEFDPAEHIKRISENVNKLTQNS